MKIILYQPQIPQNTGTIARTCAATNTGLILIRPLGFSTHSRHLKRAGLDYWNTVDIEEKDEVDLKENFFFFSSKATRMYTEAPYTPDSLLIFGSETAGLPEIFWKNYPDRFYTLPMRQGQRCLNLAISVGIVLYEAHRQHQFLLMNELTKDKNKLTITAEAKGK